MLVPVMDAGALAETGRALAEPRRWDTLSTLTRPSSSDADPTCGNLRAR